MSKGSDVIDKWAALYEHKIPPILGEGEKSISDIARENGIDHKTAKRYIDEWIDAGIIESVGLRRVKKGAAVEAYRVKG